MLVGWLYLKQYRQKNCHFLVYLILWIQRKVGILVILVKDFYEL